MLSKKQPVLVEVGAMAKVPTYAVEMGTIQKQLRIVRKFVKYDIESGKYDNTPDEDIPDVNMDEFQLDSTGAYVYVPRRYKIPFLKDYCEERVSRLAWVQNPPQFNAKMSLKPNQIAASEAIYKDGNMVEGILSLGCGRGKGQPKSAEVLTPAGWRTIGHLSVGDEIIGSDGGAGKVTGVYPRGMLPVFRVSFSDGTSLVVDEDHLWEVSKKDRNGEWIKDVRSTKQLTSDLAGKSRSRWRIPIVKPVRFSLPLPRQLTVDPYLLGVLLGDGSLAHHSNEFTPGDERVPAQVKLVLPEGTKLTSRQAKNRAVTYSVINDKRSWKNPNKLRQMMSGMGLEGIASEERFIPQHYFLSSCEERLALLQGLLDTDGEFIPGTAMIKFSSASTKLRDGVVALVQSLGGVARTGTKKAPVYKYKGERRIGKPSFWAKVHLPDGTVPTRVHPDRYVRRSQYLHPTRFLESIEPCGVEDVVCISVDTPDELYVTEHYIVTHNTVLALWLLTKISTSKVLVCVPDGGIAEQWRERINSFLAFEGGIGLIGDGECDIAGRRIVIGIVNSLAQKEWPQSFYDQFDLVIIDESHSTATPVNRNIYYRFPGRRLALDATPNRLDGQGKLLRWHIGPILIEDLKPEVPANAYLVETGIVSNKDPLVWRARKMNRPPDKVIPKPDDSFILFSALSKSKPRNDIVFDVTKTAMQAGRNILVLGKEVAQLTELVERLNKDTEGCAEAVTGSVKRKDRGGKMKAQVVCATFKLAQRALDKQTLDTLFVVVPFTDENLVRQAVGRIQRYLDNKRPCMVVFFVDSLNPTGARVKQKLINVLQGLHIDVHIREYKEKDDE